MSAIYDGAAARWATGATIVYAPIARELVRRAPHPLAERVVLDVGAGTGVGSAALRAVHARPVALDLSIDMLSWEQPSRPPAVVASVERIPVAPDSVDDVYASFVLNHVAAPAAALRELAGATRPGGAILATTFADESDTRVRDRIDDVARAAGWEPPAWYVALKAEVIPLLGTADAMDAAAEQAALADIQVEATEVDVGVTRPAQLVDYRFGQAHVSRWFDAMDGSTAAAVRAEAIAAIEPIMEPYRPTVVFLTATVDR